MRLGHDLTTVGKQFVSVLVDESEEFRKLAKKSWKLRSVNIDTTSTNIAKEIWKSTEEIANAAKFGRELHEKYGPFKDYILHPKVQWIFAVVEGIWREFHIFGKRPLPLVGTIMILVMMTRAKQPLRRIALTVAILSGMHPFVLAIVGFIYVQTIYAKRTPRGYKPFVPYSTDTHTETLMQNPFDPSIISSNISYDCIIIGSNLSSLFTAAMLSKVGKRVLVLESKNTIGHKEFVSVGDGAHEFETASLCIGNVNRYSELLSSVAHSKSAQLKWFNVGLSETSLKAHKIVHIGAKGGIVMHSTGKISTQDLLCIQYPEERNKIEQFFSAMNAISNLNSINLYFSTRAFPSAVANRILKLFGDTFSTLASNSVASLLEKITDSAGLRSALSSLFSSENISSEVVSAGSYFSELSHSLNGLSYASGGYRAIVNLLIPTVRESGGEIYTDVPIEHIRIENGIATGVILCDDSHIQIKENGFVISTLGSIETFDELLSKEDKEAFGTYPEGFELLTEAKPRVHVCVGLNGNWSDDLDFTSCDYTQVRDDGASLSSEHYANQDSEWFNIAISTGKDSSKWWSSKTSCVITTEIPDNMLCKVPCLPDSEDKRTGPFRYIVKDSGKIEQISSRMLKRLNDVYPNTIGLEEIVFSKVDYRPGLSQDSGRFSAPGLRVPTHIPGLLLGGQDLCTNDFAGKIDAGLLVGHTVLGYTPFDLYALNRGLAQDLKNLSKK